jgi:hypothetical protein
MAYESKAVVSKINATSRIAIKIKDNFYTVEFSEERLIPDVEGIDVEKERVLLFDDVNSIVDAQAEDIIKTFQK